MVLSMVLYVRRGGTSFVPLSSVYIKVAKYSKKLYKKVFDILCYVL